MVELARDGIAFWVLCDIMQIIGALSFKFEFTKVADSIEATGAMLEICVMAASAVTADEMGTSSMVTLPRAMLG